MGVKSRIGRCECHGKNCYFIQRHSRDIELPQCVEVGKEENAVALDAIASMHTFIFHNVEDQLYRLYDRDGRNRDNIIDGDDQNTKNQTENPLVKVKSQRQATLIDGQLIKQLPMINDEEEDDDINSDEEVD